MSFKIGTLARRTGTTAPTIRYYEDIGLLPRADRRESGQRIYGNDATKRLTFIRRCREFGFSIEQVKTLVSLMQDENRSCIEARDLATVHLASVRVKLVELKKLEKSIAGLVESCETSCLGGPGPECVVLEDLATSPYSHHANPARGAPVPSSRSTRSQTAAD
jgi:DNA-binding transcriptional MerR regulator